MFRTGSVTDWTNVDLDLRWLRHEWFVAIALLLGEVHRQSPFGCGNTVRMTTSPCLRRGGTGEPGQATTTVTHSSSHRRSGHRLGLNLGSVTQSSQPFGRWVVLAPFYL